LTFVFSGDARPCEQATMLHSLIKTILAPFSANEAAAHFCVTGSDIPIASDFVTGFALLLHEFATNAAKYGALSVATGGIDIECSEESGRFFLTWKEHGGPTVRHQGEEGFGSLLVGATVRHQLGGELAREWRPEGLILRLNFARDRLLLRQAKPS